LIKSNDAVRFHCVVEFGGVWRLLPNTRIL